MLPALANVGIRPVLPPHDERVRNTVYALLIRTPDATAEGQQLLEDLDSDKREVRERATRLLDNLFDLYKDLIQQKLQDKSCSAEVRSR